MVDVKDVIFVVDLKDAILVVDMKDDAFTIVDV